GVAHVGVRGARGGGGGRERTLRPPAELREPLGSQVDINLRVSGWIERLYADQIGMHLPKGAILFELYSPELGAAIEEWIAARKAAAASAGEAVALAPPALARRW